MAEVTSPLLLDDTGATIVNKLEGIRVALAAEVTPATTATAGIVKPDGTTITIDNNGTISAELPAVATTARVGVVKPDGTSISVDGSGTISANMPSAATTASLGTVKPDGTTISVDANGTISSTSSVRALTTSEINTIWNDVFGS